MIQLWEDLASFWKVLGMKEDNLLGDMKVKFGSNEIVGVFGKWGVVVNEMRGRWMVGWSRWDDTWDWVLASSFHHKLIHRRMWTRGDWEELDYITVNDGLQQDGKVVRNMLKSSDHFTVAAKVRMRRKWNDLCRTWKEKWGREQWRADR